MTTKTMDMLDDMFGYYKCKCGHDAVDHSMDAPSKYRACRRCGCKRFDLAPKGNTGKGGKR